MTISLCVFDAYGTLFDVNAAAREAAKTNPQLEKYWPTLATVWREKQLQYSWLRAVTQTHCDFWQVTQDGLDWALAQLGLDKDEALRQLLLDLYISLRPYEEVSAVLSRLRRIGVKTAILSNGTPKMLAAATAHAKIDDMFDAVLSVESVGVFKPDRRVYDMIEAHFGIERGDVLFVSSNGWDAAAASGYGFATAWINRSQVPLERLPWTPQHIFPSLSQIPDLVHKANAPRDLGHKDIVYACDIGMIEAAAKRLAGRVNHTPLINNPELDAIAGRAVYIKAEPLQKTGSFKYRGASAAITALTQDVHTKGVIAFSSGNHAQGVALAAREAGVSATIIMPRDAPAIKIHNTRALGAEVVLYDRATEDRDAIGEKLAREKGLHLIRPFDDPDVISGQGTIGLELAHDLADVPGNIEEVLVCCGGGGLSAGIALALAAKAPQLLVRPVEPENFDDVTRSLQAGRIMRNETMSGSICDAIVTPSPGNLTYPIMAGLCGAGLVVTEQQVLNAMRLAWQHLKIAIEPGGAVALASALFQPDNIRGQGVVVIASGGNVDNEIFAKALAT